MISTSLPTHTPHRTGTTPSLAVPTNAHRSNATPPQHQYRNCCLSNCTSSETDTNTRLGLGAVKGVVDDLKGIADSLNTMLGKLLSCIPSPAVSSSNEGDHPIPPAPDMPSENIEGHSQDHSFVSLDGFMFTDDGSEKDLN